MNPWLLLLGALLGLVVAYGPVFRLWAGNWVWQSHLTSRCTCWGEWRDQCPGARMGRGPKVAA